MPAYTTRGSHYHITDLRLVVHIPGCLAAHGSARLRLPRFTHCVTAHGCRSAVGLPLRLRFGYLPGYRWLVLRLVYVTYTGSGSLHTFCLRLRLCRYATVCTYLVTTFGCYLLVTHAACRCRTGYAFPRFTLRTLRACGSATTTGYRAVTTAHFGLYAPRTLPLAPHAHAVTGLHDFTAPSTTRLRIYYGLPLRCGSRCRALVCHFWLRTGYALPAPHLDGWLRFALRDALYTTYTRVTVLHFTRYCLPVLPHHLPFRFWVYLFTRTRGCLLRIFRLFSVYLGYARLRGYGCVSTRTTARFIRFLRFCARLRLFRFTFTVWMRLRFGCRFAVRVCCLRLFTRYRLHVAVTHFTPALRQLVTLLPHLATPHTVLWLVVTRWFYLFYRLRTAVAVLGYLTHWIPHLAAADYAAFVRVHTRFLHPLRFLRFVLPLRSHRGYICRAVAYRIRSRLCWL